MTIELAGVQGGYGPESVIQDVSLCIDGGQFVGLIGPSGAGKTSTLRAMLGDLPWMSGTVTVSGRPVNRRRPPAVVGYVPQVQTVDWSFPATVEDVVLMGRIQRMGPWPWPTKRDRAEAMEVLERLGLGNLAHRQIRDLSGGQQQRVFLARALAGKPEILLLDEPTASVDVATRETILGELWALHAQGVTIVLTTHELNAIAAKLPWLVCINQSVIAQGRPEHVLTELTLRRTFGAAIRVLRDPLSGAPLVVDGVAEPTSRAAD